jgi:hypothetical protein
MVAAASAAAAAGWGSGWPLARESRAGEPAATEAVVPLSFEGTPKEIGIAYGKWFAEAASRNMRVLLGARLPAQDPAFRAWVRSQEKLVDKHCPQAAKTTLWILQPKGPTGHDRFVPFAL